MPFEKGKSGNIAGRPKGSRNKTDEELREFLRKLTTEYFYGENGQMNFVQDMLALRPAMRTQVMEKYLKYFLAPQASLKIEGDINNHVQGAVRIVIEEIESTQNYIDITPNAEPVPVGKRLSNGE